MAFPSRLGSMNTPNTPALLRTPTRSEIPGLLADLDASGLGIAAFARSRNLKPHKLYVANRKRKASGSTKPVFDRVRILGGVEDRQVFELCLSSGRRVRIPFDFDPASLRRLLEVLRQC